MPSIRSQPMSGTKSRLGVPLSVILPCVLCFVCFAITVANCALLMSSFVCVSVCLFSLVCAARFVSRLLQLNPSVHTAVLRYLAFFLFLFVRLHHALRHFSQAFFCTDHNLALSDFESPVDAGDDERSPRC